MAVMSKYETLSSDLICSKKNVTVCFFTHVCSKNSKVMPIFLNILQPKCSVIVTLDAHFSPLVTFFANSVHMHNIHNISALWSWPFIVVPRWQGSLFSGMFVKLQKTSISFVVSISPSVHIEQLGSHWTKFGIWGFLENLSRKLFH
jgi:hypothetical protein